MVRHHPEASLLAEYASGSISPAMCAAVTTHLHFCTACKSHHKTLDDLGGSILERAEPLAMTDGALDRMFECLDRDRNAEPEEQKTPVIENEGELPGNIHKLMKGRNPKWKSVTPSLKAAVVAVGESRYELGLQKIKAGGTVPEHDHGGLEVTVVVSGSFSDESGVFSEGDFIIREPGDVHRPIATQDAECICLSVVEAPIKMTGPRSLLNPFLSFSPS